MSARLCTATLVVLVLIGGLATGKGAYIYAKAELAQHLIARAWRTASPEGAAQPPWPWADTHPIARLRVPAKAIDTFILEGAHGQALAFGPGHLSASAAVGDAGNSVVAGHRDTHFRFLAQLEPGDEVLIDLPRGRTVRYVVARAYVTDEHDVTPLAQRDAVQRLTLITCYPFDALRAGGPLRYVVEAHAT